MRAVEELLADAELGRRARAEELRYVVVLRYDRLVGPNARAHSGTERGTEQGYSSQAVRTSLHEWRPVLIHALGADSEYSQGYSEYSQGYSEYSQGYSEYSKRY